MENMKQIRSLAFSAALILLSFFTFAQDNGTLTEAFKKSYEFENLGEYSQAVSQLKEVYQEDSYELNVRLGWLTYSSGQFMESMAFYQKSINLKPYAIEPRFGFVLPAAALGNWDMVTNQYRKILEIDPMNTLANYRMGLISYNKEEYESALKYFEKVVNLYPFDYDSVIMYAWTNYRLNKMREAKVLFQKALLARPGDDSAMEGLSLIK